MIHAKADLVIARQRGRGEVEQAVAILEHQPSALLAGLEILRADKQRRAHLFGAFLDDFARFRLLIRDYRADAGFQNARLLEGDFRQRVAEELDMIDGHRRDDAGERTLHHVRRVETATEPDLQQQDIGGRLGEKLQRRDGDDLEQRDGRAGVDRFAFFQRARQRVFVDKFSRQPNPLVKAREVRRGVDMDTLAGRFQNRANEGDRRSLAVGSRDMNDGRQAVLRPAQFLQQVERAAQRQVDFLRMQPRQPIQDNVGTRHLTRLSRPRARAAWSGSRTAAPASRACPCAPPPCRSSRAP